MPDPEHEHELDVGRFAALFETFLERFREALPSSAPALRDRVRDHLGFDPATSSATRERYDENDLPNVQLALNELLASSSRSEVVGLPAELTQYMGFSLSSLLGGRFHGPVATTRSSTSTSPSTPTGRCRAPASRSACWPSATTRSPPSCRSASATAPAPD